MCTTGKPSASPKEASATGRPASDRCATQFQDGGLTMSVAGHQTLRVLDGSYVLDRPADVTEVVPCADALAVVFGPDGSTVMRRDDTGKDAWSALWNGDEAHDDVQATGMLRPVACRSGWFRATTATSSSSQPIGWMRLARCYRRPATKSGGDRDVGQRAYCQLSIVTPRLLVENPRRSHLPCPSALTEPQTASPPDSVWCSWPNARSAVSLRRQPL